MGSNLAGDPDLQDTQIDRGHRKAEKQQTQIVRDMLEPETDELRVVVVVQTGFRLHPTAAQEPSPPNQERSRVFPSSILRCCCPHPNHSYLHPSASPPPAAFAAWLSTYPASSTSSPACASPSQTPSPAPPPAPPNQQPAANRGSFNRTQTPTHLQPNAQRGNAAPTRLP